jgi:hypothetical protein
VAVESNHEGRGKITIAPKWIPSKTYRRRSRVNRNVSSVKYANSVFIALVGNSSTVLHISRFVLCS